MPSVLIDASDAVTAALNDRDEFTPSIEFTAERSYADWELALNDPYLHIDVVPVGHSNKRGMESGIDSRSSFAYLPMIDIGIRKRFGADEQTEDGRIVLAEIDNLVALQEEIGEYLTFLEIGDSGDFIWRDTEYRESCLWETLDSQRQYLGILRMTYEYVKDLD